MLNRRFLFLHFCGLACVDVHFRMLRMCYLLSSRRSLQWPWSLQLRSTKQATRLLKVQVWGNIDEPWRAEEKRPQDQIVQDIWAFRRSCAWRSLGSFLGKRSLRCAPQIQWLIRSTDVLVRWNGLVRNLGTFHLSPARLSSTRPDGHVVFMFFANQTS